MSQILRIAIYHHLDFGGAKVALFEWIRHLKASPHLTVDYFKYQDVDESGCDLTTLADRVFVYDPLTPQHGSIFGKIGLLLQMKKREKQIAHDMNAHNYDLVFVHHNRFLQAPMILRYLRGKTVYFCHEPYRPVSEFMIHESAASLVRKFWKFFWLLPKAILDLQNCSKASFILANSYYSRETILKYYGRTSHVIYLGVDTETFRPIENCPKENKVVSSGILLPHKGYRLTLEALSLLPKEIRPEFHLFHSKIMSNEQEHFKEQLQNDALALEVTLHFFEQRSSEEIARAYNSALTAVYAADLCPLGIVALEAMACGTPVIGIKEAGIRETIVDHVTGFLVDRHPKAMALRIEQLIRDGEMRIRLASQCRPYIEKHWSWARSSGYLFQVFSAIKEDRPLFSKIGSSCR